MNCATRIFSIGLAWIGLLIVLVPVAAGEGLAPGEATAESGSPFELEPPDGTPAPEGPDGASVEPLPEGVIADGQSLLPGEPVGPGGETWGASPVGPCCEVCGDGICCPPNWYTRQEVRFLTRDRPRGIPLTFQDEFIGFDASANPVFTPRAVLHTRSVGFDFAAGYAGAVGRYLGRDTLGRDRFLEFAYWGLNHWEESRTATGERLTDSTTFAPNTVTFGALNSGFDPATGATTTTFPFTGVPSSTFNSRVQHSTSLLVGGFNRADEHQISYESDIHNYELNLRFRPRRRPDRLVLYPSGRWRRECHPERYLSYLFGFRVMSVDEQFDWFSRGSIEVNGAPFTEVGGDYLVHTYNDLIGLQVGAELIFRQCRWSWGVRVKAGPYVNFASQISRAQTVAAADPYAAVPLDFRTSADKDDAAFIGEVGLVGTYSINPSLMLRASYDFMWVAGLALAPEQILFQTNPPDTITVEGLGYYNGLTLGLEWLR